MYFIGPLFRCQTPCWNKILISSPGTSRLVIRHASSKPLPWLQPLHFNTCLSLFIKQRFRGMDKCVRTGCTTCRKRRIKCDETKPVCGRCQAANFVCEGYMLPRRAPNTAALSTSTPKHILPFGGTPNSELS